MTTSSDSPARRAIPSPLEHTRRLIELMAALRHPDTGCPWDVAQDFASIAPYTIEEAYEVADAIASGDLGSLREELGDLLLQVVFHARMAEEQGAFDFEAVASGIGDKLVERHPHVFGDASPRDAKAQEEAWEDIKARKRGERHDSLLDDVPLALPALLRAQKLGKRAARAGFDWPDIAGARAKLAEELAELDAAIASGEAAAIGEELGDVLFSLANVARHLGLEGETALRDANAKFERRFRRVETLCAAAGGSLDTAGIDTLEAYWQRAKQEEKA